MPDGQYEYNINFTSKVDSEGFDSIKTALSEVDSSVNTTKTNLTSLNDISFSVLKESIDSVTTKLNTLNDVSFTGLQDSINAIATSLKSQGAIDTAVDSAIDSLNSMNTSVKFDTLNETLDGVASKLKGQGGLSKAVGNVKSQFTTLNKVSLSGLTATLTGVSDTLSGLERDVTSLQESFEALNNIDLDKLSSKTRNSTTKSQSDSNVSNVSYGRDYTNSANSSSSNGFNGTVLNYSGRYKKYVDRYNESQKPNVSRYMNNYFDKKESKSLSETTTQAKDLQKTLNVSSTPYLKSIIDNAKQATKSLQSLSENVSKVQTETNKGVSTPSMGTSLGGSFGLSTTKAPLIKFNQNPSTFIPNTSRPIENPAKQPITPFSSGRPEQGETGNRFAGAPRDKSMQYGYPIINNPMMGMLGAFGIKSMSDVTTGVGMQNETNQLLLGKMGADYNTFDDATNKTLTSMQDLIPAMNAMYTSANLTADQVNNTAETMATFGSYVKILTGSDILANSSMYYLSRAYHGEYRAVDQYGITDDSLKNTGLYQGAGSGDSYEHFMDAVQAVMGSQMDALMQTTQGQMAQVYKGFSRAGKQLSSYILPPLKQGLVMWNGVNNILGNIPSQLVILGSSALSVASVMVNLYNETRYTFETLDDVYKKIKNFTHIEAWDPSKSFKENIAEPLKKMGQEVDESGEGLTNAIYKTVSKIKAVHQEFDSDPFKYGNKVRNKMGMGDSKYPDKFTYGIHRVEDNNKFAQPALDFLGIKRSFSMLEYDFETKMATAINKVTQKVGETDIGKIFGFDKAQFQIPESRQGTLSQDTFFRNNNSVWTKSFYNKKEESTLSNDPLAGVKSIAEEFQKRLHIDSLKDTSDTFKESVGDFRGSTRDFGKNLYDWLVPPSIKSLNETIARLMTTFNKRVVTPFSNAISNLRESAGGLKENLSGAFEKFTTPLTSSVLPKLRSTIESAGLEFKKYVDRAGDAFSQRTEKAKSFAQDHAKEYGEQLRNHPFGQAIHSKTEPYSSRMSEMYGTARQNFSNMAHDSSLGQKVFSRFDKRKESMSERTGRIKDRVGDFAENFRGKGGEGIAGTARRAGIGGMVAGQGVSMVGGLIGGETGQTIGKLGDGLSVVSGIAGFLPDIVKGVTQISQFLMGLQGIGALGLAVEFGAVLVAVMLIKKYWDNIIGTLKGFFNWAKDIIFTIFIEPLQPLFDAFNELGSAIAGIFGGTGSGDFLVDMGNALLAVLRPLGQALMVVAKIIGGTLAVAFTVLAVPIRALAGVISWFAGLMQGLAKKIQDFFQPIVDIVKAIVDPIGAIWGKLTGGDDKNKKKNKKDMNHDGQPDQQGKTSAWIDKWREERDNPQSADDKMNQTFKDQNGGSNAMPTNGQNLAETMGNMDQANMTDDMLNQSMNGNETQPTSEIPVDASTMNMSTDDNNAGSHKRSKENGTTQDTTKKTTKKTTSASSKVEGKTSILEQIYEFMVATWGTKNPEQQGQQTQGAMPNNMQNPQQNQTMAQNIMLQNKQRAIATAQMREKNVPQLPFGLGGVATKVGGFIQDKLSLVSPVANLVKSSPLGGLFAQKKNTPPASMNMPGQPGQPPMPVPEELLNKIAPGVFPPNQLRNEFTPKTMPMNANVKGNSQFGDAKPKTDETGAPINNYITVNVDTVDSKDRINQMVEELTKALTFDNIRAGRSVGMDYYKTNT